MTYKGKGVEILDHRGQVLHNKTIPLVKVLWRNHAIEDVTWEPQEKMCIQYPNLFNQGM